MIMVVIITGFVDREEELMVLRERLRSDKFELVVIYGRRRVGKTRLVLESVRGFKYVYYLAVEGDNLRYFKRVASKVVPELRYSMEDWESYFNFLKDKIVIIDEFPNVVKEDPRVVSVFQRIVDTILKGTKTKVILLGSSVSMMSSKVLSYRSPLYGRRTASIKLGPLKFHYLRRFFPHTSWEELVEIYGLTDGMPYYIEKVRTPFWKWLEEELRRPDTFLKDEVDFLMKYEFSDASTYKKILEAIAFGKNTPKEIREYLRMRHSDIMPYLRNLIEAGFIVREVPVTEGPKSKRGRYYIADNFTAFWFRYIYPNLSAIEEGIFSVNEVREDYPNYLGQVFEKVGKQLLIELSKLGELPFKPTRIGRWWYKGLEVDVVALNPRERKALLVEVKWSKLSGKDVSRIKAKLKRISAYMGLEDYDVHYGVIVREAEDKEELVWDLRDFDGIVGYAQVKTY